MSTLTDSLATRDRSPAERRFYPRVAPQIPIPLNLGDQTAGTILNLSENGLLVSSPADPELDSVHRVSLQLDGTTAPISVYLHTVWSDPTWQKSGLQFLDLAEADRAVLRAWSARQVAQTSVCAALPAPNAADVAPFTLDSDQAARRSQWLSALEHHRRIPLRYFWASFAATLFLGATWAAVEGFLPDKIVRTPIAHLPSPRRPTDSAPSASSATSAMAAPVNPAPPPVAPPSQSLPSNLAPSQPLRDSATSPPTQKKAAAAPQLSASASVPAAANPALAKPPVSAPSVSPAPPNTSAVSSVPLSSSPVMTNSYPPPLNPRPITPNPAPPAATAHTDSGIRQPAPTPQPATPRVVAANAPLPPRVAPPPAYSPQILEIPSATTSGYVQLLGERVVRSSNLTIHIQRSVWVKASHWFWHSRKRVDLGEIVSRVDPQMPHFAPGYGKPEYGSVTVLATIAKNGQISSVRPLYGSAQLLPSVSTALHNWRYQATYLDNQPVETLARIEVDFHRPDNSPQSR